MKAAVVHLSEMDVLRGGEVEALLVALVLQQTLRESVGYFHIAAVVLLCVQGSVGQHGCGLLDVSGVQQRHVMVELVGLKDRMEIKQTEKYTFVER